jgi:tryptophan synthase alpha subunit
MTPTEVNCAEACVNGCILGDQCPNLEHREKTSKFIQETSLDQMLAIAEEATRKRLTEPPKWVYPEDL